MKILTFEGIVVSSVKYKENSKILNIFTKEKGIIGVIAKGALKNNSPLKVPSENFAFANFHVSYKENGLSTLIEADIINYFFNIKTNIVKLGYLSYLTELSKEVFKESENINIYNLYKEAILKIENDFNPIVITNIVEIKYLYYLGVGLNLDGCLVCGKTNVVQISLNKGGYLCEKHKTNEKKYSSSMLKMIRAYYFVDINKISELNIKKQVIDEIDEFLEIYYSEYTGLYLKSKKFLKTLNAKGI